MKVEYRVRPVIRYIVTRYHEGVVEFEGKEPCQTAGLETRGEYDNGEVAYQVAYALCKAEHDKSGEPIGSENFIYPSIPEGVTVKQN